MNVVRTRKEMDVARDTEVAYFDVFWDSDTRETAEAQKRLFLSCTARIEANCTEDEGVVMGQKAKRNSSVGYDGNGLEEEHKIHICLALWSSRSGTRLLKALCSILPTDRGGQRRPYHLTDEARSLNVPLVLGLPRHISKGS